MNNKIKKSFGEHVFDFCNVVFMLVVMFVMLYPFWNTVITSFNDARDSIRGSLFLWPRLPTLYNYEIVFKNKTLLNAGFISVARTVLGTVLSVTLTFMLAYVLSVKAFLFRRFLNVFLVLTMYVNAGLIPTYFLFRDLGLLDSFWVYIIPNLVGAFNVIILRTYISGLPDSYAEAAKIEGASEIRIIFTIIFPLSMPVIATVALWVAVGQWNSWFDTYIFNPGSQNLSTLQYEMMKILSSSMQMNSGNTPDYLSKQSGGPSNTVTPNSLRAAITVICTVPILLVYPFLQKYFVKGVQIGGVKE
ncbi:MAG: carbohydrate ABC transporter permease [Oscillospiraceae bacterium]|jgi:putative aldouronate transport system permease protein|nr:carbohydrate ABC transporter permease [Oscillospiraceae bacterium]